MSSFEIITIITVLVASISFISFLLYQFNKINDNFINVNNKINESENRVMNKISNIIIRLSCLEKDFSLFKDDTKLSKVFSR